LPNYRAKTAARDIISNFQKAKMEAVKRNTDVVITFTTTQAGSYRIFVDNNSDGNFTAGERVLARVNMPKDVFLYNTTFTGDKTGYNSRGLPWNNRWGRVEIRNNKLIIRATRYYQATLSSAGHVRLQTSNDGINWN
jgi:type IV fimbrial biogenesis protein FimT